MLIFGSIGLFVRYIDLASSQIALVRGFIGAAVLLFAMSVLKKSLDFSAWRKNALILLISGGAIGFNWIFLFQAYHYTLPSPRSPITLHRPSSCSYRRFSCTNASRGAN